MRLTRQELQTFVRSAMLRAKISQEIVSIDVSDKYLVYHSLIPRFRRKEGLDDVIAVWTEKEILLVPKKLERVINGQPSRRAT